MNPENYSNSIKHLLTLGNINSHKGPIEVVALSILVCSSVGRVHLFYFWIQLCISVKKNCIVS